MFPKRNSDITSQAFAITYGGNGSERPELFGRPGMGAFELGPPS
ncbi:hypothetical protein [Brachybacterium endophyticum]|nr:hypothetical protein [Brachybacterium endophyticum]